MTCCTLRGTLLAFLILALVALLERTVFDFLGYMWSPIIADIVCWMFLVVCIFGAAQRRSACLIAYLPWALVWIGWNALIICIYVDFGALQVTPVLNLNTGSVSWWVHGIGCQYNLTAAGQVDPTSVTGCALPYAYVEVLQAAVQIALGLLTFILSAVFTQRVIREENDVKVVREPEMQYIHMREEQSAGATPQSTRRTTRHAARSNGDPNLQSNTQTLTTVTGTLGSRQFAAAQSNGNGNAHPFPYGDPSDNVNGNQLLVHTPTSQTTYPAARTYPNAANSYGDPRMQTMQERSTAPTATQMRTRTQTQAQQPTTHAATGRRPPSSENAAATATAALTAHYAATPQPQAVADDAMQRNRQRQSASSARSKRSLAKKNKQVPPAGPGPRPGAGPGPGPSRGNLGTTETVLQPSDDASSDDNLDDQRVRGYPTSSFKRKQNANPDANRTSTDNQTLRNTLNRVNATATPAVAPVAFANQIPPATPAYSQPMPKTAPGRNPTLGPPVVRGPPPGDFLTHSHPRQQNVPRYPIPTIFAQSPAATTDWRAAPQLPVTPAPAPVRQPMQNTARQSGRSNLNRHTPPHVGAAPTSSDVPFTPPSMSIVSSVGQSPAPVPGSYPFAYGGRPGAGAEADESEDDALPPYQPPAPAQQRPPPRQPLQMNRAPAPAPSFNQNQPNRASFSSQRMLNVDTQTRNNPNSVAQKSPAPSTGSMMLIGAPSVV